ncbi:hypothetical protein CL622_07775 [archaeon]|nr:hypothetical protein [archaeon]
MKPLSGILIGLIIVGLIGGCASTTDSPGQSGGSINQATTDNTGTSEPATIDDEIDSGFESDEDDFELGEFI